MPDRFIVTCNKCGQPLLSGDYHADEIEIIEEDGDKAVVSFRCMKCGEVAQYTVWKVTPVRMAK